MSGGRMSNLWKTFTSSKAFGLVLAAVSGFFHTFSSSLVQYIYKTAPYLTAPQVLLVRCLIELAVVLFIMVWKKISPKGRGFYLLLGLAGTGHMLFLYYALKYIPVGDATVMLLTVPVLTLLLSYALFKKGCSVFNVAFGALSIFGVILIANPNMIFRGTHHSEIKSPSFHLMALGNKTLVEQSESINNMTMNYFLGTLFAMLAATCTSIYYISCKYAVSIGDSIFLTILYPAAIGVITCLTIIIVSPNESLELLYLPTTDVILLLSVGVLTTLSLYFMTCGLDLDDAGPVVLIRNFDVVYGYFFQFLLVGYNSSTYTIVGALVVIFSTLMVVLNREFEIDQKYCCGKFLSKDKEKSDTTKENTSLQGSHTETEMNEPLLTTSEN